MRKRVIPVLLALFCAAMTLALPVTAAETGTDEWNTNLTLHYYIKDQKRPMSGVTFYLYKVGDYVSGSDRGIYDFTPTRDFDNKDCRVDLKGLDFRTGVDYLTDLVNELVPYTEMHKDTVKPAVTDETDSNGDLTFKNLGPGLYLVWGEMSEITEADGNGGIREWKYTPQAFLIPLPYPMPDDGLAPRVEVEVKYEQFPPPTTQDIDITVKKKWEPEGKSHPDSVIVALLRNGKVVDVVELNAGNRWKNTWNKLDPTIRWEVAEKDIPDGYTVSVNREGYYYTITNKSADPDDPDPPPPSEDDPPPDDLTPVPSDDPIDPTSSGVPDVLPILSNIPNDTDRRRLPQTGQLWWPVPLLVAVGVLLFLIGAALFVRKEKSEEFEKPYE